MKPFRFTLQRLLDLREGAENDARAAVAQIRRIVAEAQAEVERLQQERSRWLHTDAFTSVHGDVERFERTNLTAWIVELEHRIHAQQEYLQTAREQENQALAVLLERSRERKKVEKLKGRQWEEFKKEQTRQAGRELDEVAIRAYQGRSTA